MEGDKYMFNIAKVKALFITEKISKPLKFQDFHMTQVRELCDRLGGIDNPKVINVVGRNT